MLNFGGSISAFLFNSDYLLLRMYDLKLIWGECVRGLQVPNSQYLMACHSDDIRICWHCNDLIIDNELDFRCKVDGMAPLDVSTVFPTTLWRRMVCSVSRSWTWNILPSITRGMNTSPWPWLTWVVEGPDVTWVGFHIIWGNSRRVQCILGTDVQSWSIVLPG